LKTVKLGRDYDKQTEITAELKDSGRAVVHLGDAVRDGNPVKTGARSTEGFRR
jgi:hypothetical protein